MTALASAGTETDIIVVGAGVAGLAAARHLRAANLRVELIEASHRTGGRAYTSHPAALGGPAFDHGAQWLHAAHRNPLVSLAQAHGETVVPETPWEDRMQLREPDGTQADIKAYLGAEADWRAAVIARLGAEDCSLAQAASCVSQDPWTATIEAWEGAIIAAADADELSLADWHANELEGDNYIAPGGLGALISRLLATPVRHGIRALRIAAIPGGVRVETDCGPLQARAAIVTVSTGVLRAEHIGFSPALPAETLAALDGLPMGLLSKIVLRASGPDRRGLPPGAGVFRRLRSRGAPFLSTLFWLDRSDLAVGYIGGRAAWALAGKPDTAEALMRDEMSAIFGHNIFAPGHLATDWGTNENFLGAYAYARPGHAGARAALAAPLWDGRLAFAGEACATDGMAGTVAGAYQTGRAAAQTFLDGFPTAPGCV